MTLGSDISGTVAALGAGVGVFALGDAVYGATNDQFVGGYAEYALVEAGKIARKPAALHYVTAAGLPVVAVTAWQMLFEHARIEPGQAILVRGAAGSVGVCATQMAKEAGASVYGTARAPAPERVRALGAEPVVEGARVGAQLASRPLNAVIDTIGGDALESTWEALRPNGIIVSIVRPPDEAYLRSQGVRAAYFIVDVTRVRPTGDRLWSRRCVGHSRGWSDRCFFKEPSVEALVGAVRRYQSMRDGFNPELIAQHARAFDKSIFMEQMTEVIQGALAAESRWRPK